MSKEVSKSDPKITLRIKTDLPQSEVVKSILGVRDFYTQLYLTRQGRTTDLQKYISSGDIRFEQEAGLSLTDASKKALTANPIPPDTIIEFMIPLKNDRGILIQLDKIINSDK